MTGPPTSPTREVPSWAPTSAQLDDVECLLLGAYGPGRRVGTAVDDPSPAAPPPVPPLRAPASVVAAAQAAGAVDLLDEEGTPVARLRTDEPPFSVEPGLATGPGTGDEDETPGGLCGEVEGLRPMVRSAAAARQRPAAGDGPRRRPLLVAVVDEPATRSSVSDLRDRATTQGASLLVLPLTGARAVPRRGGVDGDALARTWLAEADEVTDVVPVPVPAHDDAGVRPEVGELVARSYGADLVVLRGLGADEGSSAPTDPTPATARELRRASPGGHRGVVVLLTGLSGSGKSTVARALVAALVERTDRAVTLLDGDRVRRLLSAGLGFSREGRENNVRRIGWVAAEVARHGGVAVCAPIAPYATTRAEVRDMAQEHGRFLLVHVATPLEVCEARDRKGLYARARAGDLPAFTGISDPYEDPVDADVVLDTSTAGADEAADALLAELARRSWVLVPDATGRAGA